MQVGFGLAFALVDAALVVTGFASGVPSPGDIPER
jgi:hypothetical protein